MTALREEIGHGEFIASKRGILLDVGCGAFKQGPTFVGMDLQEDFEGVDVVHNWNDFQWPFEDESALTIVANHVVEHVSPIDGHFIRWMDECWRVLKVGGQFGATFPYGTNARYCQDPTHVNPCNEVTWMYFAKDHPSGLWNYYKPNPWEIQLNKFHHYGDGEIVLRKCAL